MRGTRARRVAAVLLTALALGAMSLATAAQLGVASATLQAGDDVVATCQPTDAAITVEPVVQLSNGSYVVSAVRVSGVSTDCNGHQFKARLLRTDGTTIGSELSGTLVLPAQPFDVPVPSVSAATWGGVSIVIFD